MASIVVARAFSSINAMPAGNWSDRHRQAMLLIDCPALLRLEDVINWEERQWTLRMVLVGAGFKAWATVYLRNWTRLQALSEFWFMQSWSTDRYGCSRFCDSSFLFSYQDLSFGLLWPTNGLPFETRFVRCVVKSDADSILIFVFSKFVLIPLFGY